MNPILKEVIEIQKRIDRLPPNARMFFGANGAETNGATPTKPRKPRKPLSAEAIKKLRAAKKKWWREHPERRAK